MLSIMVVGESKKLHEILRDPVTGADHGPKAAAVAANAMRSVIDVMFPDRMTRINRARPDGNNIATLSDIRVYNISQMVPAAEREYIAFMFQFEDHDPFVKVCKDVPDLICYYGEEISDPANWGNQFFRSRMLRDCDTFVHRDVPYTLRDFMCYIESTHSKITKVPTVDRTSYWSPVLGDGEFEHYTIISGGVGDLYHRSIIASNIFMLHAIL